jgi:hypothetical protein
MARKPDNHAGAAGHYCKRCSSAVGESVKVQPCNCDSETFCPRCFVWWRMNAEPDRFNASQACVVKCQFCAWTAPSYGGQPGKGLRCSQCGKWGALKVPIDPSMLTPVEHEAIRDALHTA